MNSKEAFVFLQELEGRGIKLSLDRMHKALEFVKVPKEIVFVKVAGTNGKGTTSTFIAEILKQAGYKTGLYLSPHIKDFEERIQVNGKKISKKDLVQGISVLKNLDEKHDLQLSHFEFVTVIALKHFLKEKCTAVVLETGMGGRLDATNALKASLNVITNVSLEHEQYLGHSLEQIAEEKAGIIDEGITVVSGEEKAEVLKILRRACKENESELVTLNKDFSYYIKEKSLGKSVFNLKNKKLELKDLEIGFGGTQFVKNASLAVQSALLLGVEEEAVRKGLEKAEVIGRFQVLQENPLVLLDCAHNIAGLRELNNSLKELVEGKTMTVFGCSDDKNFEEMVKEVCKFSKKVYCTQAEYRGLNAEVLEHEFQKNGFENVEVEKEVKKALGKALKEAGKKDTVLVCGSCFVIGEVLS